MSPPSEQRPGRPRGLLSIFAHPDDESFGAGGTMAMLASEGVPVHLVCATNGDQGGAPGQEGVDHSMDPAIRREELVCACAAMGIAPPRFLGYRDSGMEGWGAPEGALSVADTEEVVERLLAEIRAVRPAAILTFDPGGIYGHPDHVAVSRFATEAYTRAAREPGGPVALYHQAVPRSRAGDMRRMMEEVAELAGEVLPAPGEDDRRQAEAMSKLARPDEDFTVHVDIRPALDRKLEALACHSSQMRGRLWDMVPRTTIEQYFGEESFVRVDPPPSGGEREARLRVE